MESRKAVSRKWRGRLESERIISDDRLFDLMLSQETKHSGEDYGRRGNYD
jgi:hypothetical protein